MNFKTKTLLTGALFVAASVLATAAQAETTANIGVTNNYIFRGITQSNDLAAVSGGVDWNHKGGAYAGGWTSNLSGGQYELDLYGGYSFDTGAFGHDFGGIIYAYPVGDVKSDYGEIYYNFDWSWITAGVAVTIYKESDAGTNDIYAYFGGDWEMDKNGFGLGFRVGRYTFDGAASKDYNHLRLHASKDDFTVAIEKNDADNTAWSNGIDDVRFTVSWSKNFDIFK